MTIEINNVRELIRLHASYYAHFSSLKFTLIIEVCRADRRMKRVYLKIIIQSKCVRPYNNVAREKSKCVKKSRKVILAKYTTCRIINKYQSRSPFSAVQVQTITALISRMRYLK